MFSGTYKYTWVAKQCGRGTSPRGRERPLLYLQAPEQEGTPKDMSVILGSALLGATTFCARQHGADECDSKGLPLTPNSTNILGRFESLKALSHPHLTLYLDAKKLKNGTHDLT